MNSLQKVILQKLKLKKINQNLVNHGLVLFGERLPNGFHYLVSYLLVSW